MAEVVVVGAGITGLAAAWRLVEAAPPVQVTLLEATERVGGAITTDRTHGVTMEGGPDSVLSRKPAAIRLMGALGLGSDLIATRPELRGASLWWNGALVPIPPGVAQGIPARLEVLWHSALLSERGKRRALLDLWKPVDLPPDDVSLGHVLDQRFGRELVDRLAAPMLAGIYAGDIRALSLDSTAPGLRDWLTRSGSLSRGLRAARRAAPAPSGPIFQTLASGLETFVTTLRDRIAAGGGTVRCGEPADRVITEASGIEVLTEQGRRYRADAVILAVPAWAAAPMVAGLSADAASLLRAIPYANLAVVGLWYGPGRLPVPRDASGVLVPAKSGLSLTALTYLASKWAYRETPVLEPIRAFYGRAGEPDVLTATDGQLAGQAAHDVARVLGVPGVVPEHTRVFRHPRSMPQYLTGHQERVARIDAALAPWPMIGLAGSWRDGVGVPDCVRQGEEAAQSILAALGRKAGAGRGAE